MKVKIEHWRQKLNIQGQKLNIQGQNLNIDNVEKIKINEMDVIGTINRSMYSDLIKEKLLKIYDMFFNEDFGRGDVIDCLNASKTSGTSYIKYLLNLDIIKPVSGKGKGRYRFK